ncbi:MAG: protein translocase SEC61 complex subunit gamma [Candidatus Nanoarchaeia archaeon]|nr:protein translocase SEC61 complex subunit gamma [Candidatus Nanoarchaeia archaeon]MDD5357551.1 protein translocase SEC61 complex subunit gamma [Candidatus Nanoarchaeia archaeon]MDD5588470.1 protein translocase SEC61 complex subunit gamma [Candidatus Nanoarchaeia archaeon]
MKLKLFEKIKSFVAKCRRVWTVLKKPTRDEFLKIAKVSAVGIMIIGALGFLISIVMKLFIG